ncbi:MAG: phage tail protein [Deltaproteobacteria bacterium]|nr:phage tail protein [Deltaproteobacteria bacterium]
MPPDNDLPSASQSGLRSGTIRNGSRPADIGFLFRVRGPSGVIGDFQSVEGLSRSIEVLEYAEGARNGGMRVFPGPIKHGRVTLKSGIMSSPLLYEWIHAVEVGKKFSRDLIISQLDRLGVPLRVFTLDGAFPVEWKAPALDATNSNVPVEELTLVFDGLKMEVKGDGV